jgi:hypothetical protein
MYATNLDIGVRNGPLTRQEVIYKLQLMSFKNYQLMRPLLTRYGRVQLGNLLFELE